MTANGYVESWYGATANAPLTAPALAGDIDCDVCIVGGGLTGLSAALELKKRGFDTVVLDAERAGWGCSGRSGGQLIAGFACDTSRLERLVGDADSKQLWAMSLEAVKQVRDRVREYNIDCSFRPGMMHAAIKPRQRDELLEWQNELGDTYGYNDLQWLTGDALREKLASPRYIGGLLDMNSGHLHPLNYTLGLARAAQAAGVKIFERSEVTSIKEGTTPLAVTAGGRVKSRFLILAGNAHLGPLTRRLHRYVMPVGTYIVATEPLGEARAASLIPSDIAVSDINFVLDYFRRSYDHRLLFGGRVSYSTLEPPNLTASLLKRMRTVFPSLATVKAEYTWGGYVAITRNRAPHFGRLNKNVYFAQGFSGHGMATTGLAGSVIAEAVAGTAERLDIFEKIPHRAFPGGRTFRTPLLVLATAWYRLRDLM